MLQPSDGEKMEHDKFNPGAAKYGNFINYYQFNPSSNRLKLIPSNLLAELNFDIRIQSVIALDIGCNAGNLTLDFFEYLTGNIGKINLPKTETCGLYILGIDLDSTLIQRCNERNNYPSNITFKNVDFMKTDDRENCIKSYLQSFSKEKLDFVFAFSVTMWIHLNHGDEGLKTFLNDITKITKYLILEPQPWKCYKTAMRRRKRLQECPHDMSSINIRENIEEEIHRIAVDCGLEPIRQFGQTSWDRKIILYRNSTS